MKNTVLMSAMMMAGLSLAVPVTANASRALTEVSMQEEQIQIKPDDLPTPVKQTIASDETLKEYPVAEAWQIKSVSGKVTYKVGFDNGTADKLWKTYDPQGKEITE